MSKAHQLAGRIGGYATAARHDTRTTTSKARQTFQASFEAKVDPDGILAPAERARRAEAARNEYYARLSAAGVKARREQAS
jgi:hypothetical protein